MVAVTFVIEMTGVDLDDAAGDAAGFGVPADVVADGELRWHGDEMLRRRGGGVTKLPGACWVSLGRGREGGEWRSCVITAAVCWMYLLQAKAPGSVSLQRGSAPEAGIARRLGQPSMADSPRAAIHGRYGQSPLRAAPFGK